MSTAIQFLRSGEASLRPDPTTLADGMPMINTNENGPGLFFRLRDNSLCKIGPIHVGSFPPNINPTGVDGNTIGEAWLDTSDASANVFKVFNGVEFVAVSGGGGGGTGTKGQKVQLAMLGQQTWCLCEQRG